MVVVMVGGGVWLTWLVWRDVVVVVVVVVVGDGQRVNRGHGGLFGGLFSHVTWA